MWNRSLNERSGCTQNDDVNKRAISIALAGNFDTEEFDPDSQQGVVLKRTIQELNRIYKFRSIMPHSYASPTGCAGKHLNEWLATTFEGWQPPPQKKYVLSRYYTPVPNQPYYFRMYEGRKLLEEALRFGVITMRDNKVYYDGVIPTEVKLDNAPLIELLQRKVGYLADFEINCQGNCLSTASTYKLKPSDAYRVVACPKKYPFGTKFIVNGSSSTCWDRGGAITEDGNTVRLDIWSGIGTRGLENIRNIAVPENPRVDVILP